MKKDVGIVNADFDGSKKHVNRKPRKAGQRKRNINPMSTVKISPSPLSGQTVD